MCRDALKRPASRVSNPAECARRAGLDHHALADSDVSQAPGFTTLNHPFKEHLP